MAAESDTSAPPDGRREKPLAYQRCRWCGTTQYHRLLCRVCASSELRTERSEGLGVVRRTTVVRRNTPAARNVSLVEMAEGFTVRGRVKGPFIAIHPGGRVRLTVAEDPIRGEPVFELLDDPFTGGRY
ncbi:zinc ribbon domain-containing protein [Streptomyces sp. NPDC059785]|uniref:zinc ribbon domain-containing protein n=1 Tax=unclassified Streptomyces TaxID=2593676 RepID=UPI00365A80F2